MSRPEHVKEELQAMMNIGMDVPLKALQFVDDHKDDVQTHLFSMSVSDVADMILDIVR